MTIYTLYCRRPDGVSLSFETAEAPSLEAARERASALLRRHASSSHVSVCENDREVLVVRRQAGAPEAVAAALGAGEAADLGVAVIATAAEGTITFWNRAAARLYGWSEEEALGQNIMEVTPAVQSRRQAQAIMRALQAGQAWEGEIVLKKRDGTPFVVDMPVGAVAQGQGVIVGASVPVERRELIAGRRGKFAAALQACWTEARRAAEDL